MFTSDGGKMEGRAGGSAWSACREGEYACVSSLVPASARSPVSLCMTLILFLLLCSSFVLSQFPLQGTLLSIFFILKLLYVKCILWEIHICVNCKTVCTPTVSLQLLEKQYPHVPSKLHVFSFLKTHRSITAATRKWATYWGTHFWGAGESSSPEAINYSQGLLSGLTSFHYKSPGKARDGGKTSQHNEGCVWQTIATTMPMEKHLRHSSGTEQGHPLPSLSFKIEP